MSDTYRFILKLRAIRDYKDEPLTDDHLKAVLEAGRWTGSSKNHQAWKFVAVTDPHRLEALAGCGTYTQPIRNSVAAIVLVQEANGNPFDIGRAAQNIMLAAKAIGVASCPITLHDTDRARELIGVPAGAVARYAVSLGYPSDDAQPRRWGRKTADQVVSIESY